MQRGREDTPLKKSEGNVTLAQCYQSSLSDENSISLLS